MAVIWSLRRATSSTNEGWFTGVHKVNGYGGFGTKFDREGKREEEEFDGLGVGLLLFFFFFF